MTESRCVRSSSDAETRRLGAELGEVLEGGDAVALSGDLGAGKTTLVQGIARGLGVAPEVPVTSPTFTLVGEYPGRYELRHADFYRVEHQSRLIEAGFEDLLDRFGVLVVEWPERFWDLLPAERLDLRIEIVGDDARHIEYAGRGRRGMELMRRLEARWG